jgi:hypothetical protein
MNILHLEINDLKRISAIEIDPATGKPVILTGDNGQGKSSVLDGILLALSNTGLDDPIRHGRPAANIKLTLGADKAEYLLERKITKKGSYLTLTTAEGLPVQKAQTFLNGLLGNYAFDPLEFTRLKPRDQVEALKAAAGLDFSDLDAKRARYYVERTTVGRDGKEAAAQLTAVPEPSEGVPSEEVSAAELVGTLSDLESKARVVEKLASDSVAADKRRRDAISRIEQIEKEMAEARVEFKDADDASILAREEYAKAKGAAPAPEQITEARNAIAKVDETNRAVRQARKHKELSERVTKLRSEYATLDRRIEEIDIEKSNAIKEAALPIDGLELTDEGVLMNGVFFSQLSTAEQIRISALVAMSQNPDLRIILIREGALMNSANLKMLSGLAAERGFQCWIEKFSESPGNEGLHIEDGAIAYVDGKEVAP